MNGGLRHLDSQKCKLGPGLVFWPILNSFALGERWKKDNERANLGLRRDFHLSTKYYNEYKTQSTKKYETKLRNAKRAGWRSVS